MGYGVVHAEDVPVTDLSEVEEVPPDLSVGSVGEALGAENLNANLWYFEPGEEIQYHAHREQEELYYVLEGRFSLKLGPSGEEEYVEVGPGAFYVAGPETGHGHRYLGDERGVVLALGAPAVDDPGIDPHDLEE
ncbi:cupin domain-containing protein [Halobacteriales archaeon QS_5_70_17]|jgi:quercetin dioxygenase-like cupin family protein|nr:MAG: cupin domain-containing protein [Halobacteriales archaeon QS_5_70_17]